MKRLRKKAFALLLTAAMVVSMAPAAFAGTFSDVSSSDKYAGAVERLAGLGVVKGFPDGTYGPKGTFTRAQAAAIAVRLRGISSVGTGATEFSDVAADHWASGWINMATGLGIIKGMGDGTFHPEDPVTHAQWLTMALRVLGYGPQVDKMSWPAGVLAKAALIGLDKGVSVYPNLPAQRYEVALVADNTLTKEIVDCGFDANGNVTNCAPKADTSVAENYLKATSRDGVLTVSPELFANAGDDTVTVVDGDDDTDDDLTFASGANYKGLLGHEVTAWMNSDDEVFFLEDKTAASDVKTGTVDADGNVDIGDDEDPVDISDATVYRNFVADGVVEDGDAATVIYDGDEPAYVIATAYTLGIVDSVSTTYRRVNFTAGNLKFNEDANVSYSGAASKLSEIKADDVVQYVADDNPADNAVVVVTRNAKSGKLTKLTASKATIGGTAYEFGGGIDNGDFAGMSGDQVKVLLDKDGKIVSVEAVEADVTEVVAAVTKAPYDIETVDGTVYYMKVLKSDGTKATLRGADEDADGNDFDLSAEGIEDGDVIQYTVNKDGQVDSVTSLVDYDTDAADLDADEVDADNHTVGNVVMPSGVVVFDYTEYEDSDDTADITTAKRADVEGYDTVDGWLEVDEDNASKATVIVVSGGTGAESDLMYGVVVESWEDEDEDDMVTVLGKTSKDYVDADGALGSPADDGTVIAFTLSGDELTLGNGPVALDLDEDEIRITEIDAANGLVTVTGYTDGDEGDSAGAVINSDTVYLDLTGDTPKAISKDDLSENDVVAVYFADEDGDTVADNNVAKVVAIIE